jgi:dTDP-4-dehydrorhamnose reductase
LAWKVNVEGTKNLALASKKVGTFMINISTDFIFPGNEDSPGPYKEDAKLPKNDRGISWYGWTKLKAEEAIKKVMVESATVRISYPYRANYDGKVDFARSILNLFDEGKLYPMFADQKMTPTFIDDACKVIDTIIKKESKGVFHAVSADLTTPYLFASYLIEKAKGKSQVVKKGSMKEFFKSGDRTPRPRLGGLLVGETQKKLGISLTTWKEGIDKFLHQRSV